MRRLNIAGDWVGVLRYHGWMRPKAAASPVRRTDWCWLVHLWLFGRRVPLSVPARVRDGAGGRVVGGRADWDARSAVRGYVDVARVHLVVI